MESTHPDTSTVLPRPGAHDPVLSDADKIDAAGEAFLRVRHGLLEDALSDILRASARRDGIDL